MGRLWRVLRGALKGLVVLVLLAVIALEGVVFWLQTASGNRFLRQATEQVVTDQMAEGRLTVGQVTTDLFTHLRVDQVALEDGEGRPVVSLDSLRLDWRAVSLLQKELALDRVILEQPVVDLQADGDGLLDVLRMFPSQSTTEPVSWEGLPVDLRLGELQVNDGRFSYRDGETHVAIEDLNGGLRASATGRDVHGDSLVLEGRLVAPLALPISVRGDARFEEGDLWLEGVVAAVGEDAVLLDGIVRDIEQPELLALEGVALRGAGLDLDRLEGLVGDLGVAGSVDLSVGASGPLEALSLDARLTTVGGQVEATGSMDLAAETPTWQVRVETEGLECQGLVDAVTESVFLNAALALQGSGLAFPDGVEVTGDLVAGPSVIWNYPLDGGTSRLRWSGGKGRVEAFHGDMGWASAAGTGEFGLQGTDLRVDAKVNDLLGLAIFGVPDIAGTARGQGALEVDWSGVEADVRFVGTTQTEQVNVQGMVDVGRYNGTVDATVIGTSVEVFGAGRAVDVDASGALVEGVEVDWRAYVRADGALLWEAAVDGGPLDIEGFLGVEAIHGRVSGEDDQVSEPRIMARLELFEAHLGAIRGDAGRLALELQGDVLQAGMTLEEDGQKRLALRAYGNLADGRYEVPLLELIPPDNAAWTNPEPLRVRVVEGGVEDLSVLLDSEVGRLAITGTYLAGERVNLRGVVDGFHLDWVEALISDTTGGWGGEAAATVRLQGEADNVYLDVQVAVQDLVIPDQVEGLDMEFEMLGEGEQLLVSGRVEDDGLPLFWGGGTLPVAVNLEAPGPLPEGSLDVHLEGGPVALASLAEHLPALAGLTTGQVSGELNLGGMLVAPEIDLALGLELGVGAPAEYIRLDLDVHEQDGQFTVQGQGHRAGTLQLLLEGTALTGLDEVLLGALVDDQPQPDTGDPATWLSDLDLRVVPVNIDLATWSQALGVDLEIQGLLAGGVLVNGAVDRPQVTAGLQVVEMVLGEIPVTPALLTLVPVEGGYEVKLMGGTGEGELSLAGHVPFDRESEESLDLDQELARAGLDLSVSVSDIPLAMLQLFDPGITEPAGVLEIAGKVEGSVAEPDPVVSFSVRDGGFNYEPLLVTFSDLDLFLVLDHQDLTVQSGSLMTEPMFTDARQVVRESVQRALEVTGVGATRVVQGLAGGVAGDQRVDRKEPQGGIVLSGGAHLGLDGLRDLDLQIGANFAWLMDTTALVVAYTGDVNVGGDWPNLVVEGDVGLDKFRYFLDARAYLGQEGLRLDPALEIDRPGYVSMPPPPLEPEFWEAWDIRSRIDLGYNTKLKVEVPLDTSYGTLAASASTVALDSFIRGQVDATVRGYEVYAEGEVETYEGTTRILGRVFGIEQGLVSFAGSDVANPVLDIEATHETAQYGDISVQISNNVEQMAMMFDSTQGWSETDIVAILLLGRPTSQFSQAQGGSSHEALDIALGMVAGQVEKLAGDNLVDTIEIETSSEAALEGVKVGWAVGRNLFFTLNYTATTDDEENKIEGALEWVPVSSWYLTATTGDQGQSSLEVFKVWNF